MLVDFDKLLVDAVKHPSFCTLLFKQDFIDKILIPPAFMKDHKKMLAKTCFLKMDKGMPWEAKIVREKSNFFICEGEWPQFVVHHKLELGDILLFFLIDKSTFQVFPYTQKSCRNLCGCQLLEELSSSSESESESESEDEEEDNIGASRRSNNYKMEPKEPSKSEEERFDPSSGENPCYSHSGGQFEVEADKMLGMKKKAWGQPTQITLARDLRKPARPECALAIFIEEFIKQNPNIQFSVCAGWRKWIQLSDADKAPYIAAADKRKTEYEKNMNAYNIRVTAVSSE